MPLAISSSHNGQTIAVKAGDTVELRLPENPSTGYRWAVDAIDEAYAAIGETGFHGRADVGGGGEAYWRLLAIGAGKTAVKLKRWRPFEGDRSIVERFAITLLITG